MAIKVDVPFDMKILEFYKLAQIMLDMPAKKTAELNAKAIDYKSKIKNNVVRDNVGHLYERLSDTEGVPNHIRLEEAVNEFEDYLRKKTGQHYEIKLVINGNL